MQNILHMVVPSKCYLFSSLILQLSARFLKGNLLHLCTYLYTIYKYIYYTSIYVFVDFYFTQNFTQNF